MNNNLYDFYTTIFYTHFFILVFQNSLRIDLFPPIEKVRKSLIKIKLKNIFSLNDGNY